MHPLCANAAMAESKRHRIVDWTIVQSSECRYCTQHKAPSNRPLGALRIAARGQERTNLVQPGRSVCTLPYIRNTKLTGAKQASTRWQRAPISRRKREGTISLSDCWGRALLELGQERRARDRNDTNRGRLIFEGYCALSHSQTFAWTDR